MAECFVNRRTFARTVSVSLGSANYPERAKAIFPSSRSVIMRRALTMLVVFASGCATNSGISHIPVGMRVATADAVSGCRLLGDVHGVSGLYGVFAGVALSHARQNAFEQAEAMGANTIVWTQFATPYGSTSVAGNAYSCRGG